jgi:hypothetical protein
MNLLPLVEETFSSEIKLAYQQEESNFKNLVTLRPGVIGDTTYFNRSQAGTEAGQKSRFGKIPRNGGSLDRVACTLETYFAGDEIDEQEISDTSANGMLVITTNAMASMNQKVDSLIKTAMDTTTNEIATASAGMTIDKVKEIWKKFQDAYVFKRKETPIVMVGSDQWNDLMAIDTFVRSDYIGSQHLPWLFSGAEQGKLYYDMIFKVDPSLPVSGSTRKCFAFVKSSVGLATSGINKTRVLETEDDTILYYARQKLGACLIDSVGCIEVQCTES